MATNSNPSSMAGVDPDDPWAPAHSGVTWPPHREVETVASLALDDRQTRLLAVACGRRVWDILPPGQAKRVIEVAEAFADGLASEAQLQMTFLSAGGEKYVQMDWPWYDDAAPLSEVYHDAYREIYFYWDSWLNQVITLFPAAPDPYSCVLVLYGCLFRAGSKWGPESVAREAEAQLKLAHDIAGPLVCPIGRLQYEWCRGAVWELFRRIHLTGAAAALPELVTALRDAGCDDRELLDLIAAYRPVAFDPAWRTDAAVGLARAMYAARDFAPMPALADALAEAGCDDKRILDHCREPGEHVRGCWVVDRVLGWR